MRKNTVLLVDDDSVMRKFVGRYLEEWGYEVVTADDGDVAIEKIKNNMFDLIITDLIMARVDGLDVLKAAKKIDPQAMVIVLTGYASIDTAVEALRLKADDYVIKPCKEEELELKVGKCMEIINNNRKINQLKKFLPICSVCERVCDSFSSQPTEGEWITMDAFLEKKVRSNTPYLAYCPECIENTRKDAENFSSQK